MFVHHGLPPCEEDGVYPQPEDQDGEGENHNHSHGTDRLFLHSFPSSRRFAVYGGYVSQR
ncbi:Cytochrome c oxidase polypeptide 2A [Thermus sp. CCB_US3_UF1]|nr:Cytochrome c oxidase polypeptide 2A [Thermus sp. CCB_US3_UF1]